MKRIEISHSDIQFRASSYKNIRFFLIHFRRLILDEGGSLTISQWIKSFRG